MLYIKALHIIFIVTWFAGLFYMPRLFIYNTEAQNNPSAEAKAALTQQFTVMMQRLWRGITIPSALLTLIFGPLTLYLYGYLHHMPAWLWIKLGFVFGLYLYFIWLHKIFKQQVKGIFKYTSTQLRIINEIATIFLIAIVFLVSVRDGMSLVYGLLGLLGFIFILMSAVRIYKTIRTKKENQ
ncbi:MAG: protoporphyrinogen IX oxidase [Bacteroidetes bacterium 43-16]|nr:MAG: protoporphyrinogen IX oxidase [Bacteroidetes bacterium 43-16]